MLTGKRFRLETPTLALDIIDGKSVAITVPAGAIIKVVSDHPGEGDRMVDVVLEGRIVAMFAYDVDVRGTEITEPGNEAPESRRRATA